jgi:glyoxylase I family protein
VLVPPQPMQCMPHMRHTLTSHSSTRPLQASKQTFGETVGAEKPLPGSEVYKGAVVGNRTLFLNSMSRPIHPNETIRGCGFHHVAIGTRNWDASMRFYTEGLGFTPRIEWGEAPKRGVMLDTGDGNYLEIFERDADWTVAATEANVLHFCLRTTNVVEALERARAAGAEVTVEPTVPTPFTALGLKTCIAFFKGPDGEVVEFFECDDL